MHITELGGHIQHRTQSQWERVGRDTLQRRILRIDGVHCYLGHADGSANNCLIDTLCKVLCVDADVAAVRRDLMAEFPPRCGPHCSPRGVPLCTTTCTKVYYMNFLTTDHWEAVLRAIGRHCISGACEMDPALYCLRVIELTWADNGVVLGSTAAPNCLNIAREGTNHFIPVLTLEEPLHPSCIMGVW